ncbi:MAG: PDZ domain-containing protein [Candidatus Acidiferrales bacterium]
MRQFAYPGLAGAGAVLLVVLSGLGATPAAELRPTANPTTAVETATQPQQAISRLGQTASDAASATSNQKCKDLDECVEQIEARARTIEKEVEARLPDLERAAKEVEMSSPEMSKLSSLSAKLQAKQDELESRAEELSARAEELAQKVQQNVQDKAQELEEKSDRVFAMSPGVFVSSSDEGGWLGVEIGEVTAEKAKDMKLSTVRGVIVDDVEPDSPAAKAGIKEHDVITQYDGQPVEGTVQFRRLVGETPPGRTITLAISRGGATQNISVELGDRSAYFVKKMKGKMRDFGEAYSFSLPNFNVELPDMPDVMDARTPSLGINAEDLTGQLGSYFGAPNDAGILVREVRPGTPAEKAGLKAGDVIVKLEGNPVRTLADLRAQLREKSDQTSVAMGVLRKGSEITVTVPIEKPRPMEHVHTVHRAQL